MNYLFHILPKILFYPVYAAGWCGLLLCCAAAVKKLRLSGGKNWKYLLPLLFGIAVLLLGFGPIRSARYIFMLAFPFTLFASLFLIGTAECFRKSSLLLLAVFTLAITAANTLKVLHQNSSARFAETTARQLRTFLAGEPQEGLLLLGNSRELGRIAYNAGYAYYHYPFPIEDAVDLALLKEHFCDRYQTLILVYNDSPIKNPLLPEPFLSVRKKNTRINFCKPDLSSVNIPDPVEKNGPNLFQNADLSQPMDRHNVERIKTYFKNNPEVLKIVARPDFVWPYAWHFDHAGNYFPERDFDLKLDKTPQGDNAIHIQCRSALPFFHRASLPMDKNYLLGMKIRALADSELSVRQCLRLNGGKVIFEEIKLIALKAGSERRLSIPVYPGKLLRLNETERRQGKVSLFFILHHGNVQFSAFTLREIEGDSLCKISH